MCEVYEIVYLKNHTQVSWKSSTELHSHYDSYDFGIGQNVSVMNSNLDVRKSACNYRACVSLDYYSSHGMDQESNESGSNKSS